MRHAAALTALLLLGLFARSFYLRWQMLLASPYPLGVDGYFYPIQLRALLEQGQLAYPASPLAFWLMAPLAAATDPITGAKLGAALAGAAVVWPAYALGARLGQRRVAGLAAAVVAVSSTGSLMLTVDFVKNSFGVCAGLAALAALLAALDRPSSRWRLALAALAFAAALATHKMAAGLVLLAGLPALIAWAWQRGGRALRVGGAALALGVVGLVVAGALEPARFLSLAQLDLLRGVVTGTWRWDAPALVVGTYQLPLDGEAWKAGLACALAAVALLAASRWGATREPRPRPEVTALTWALLGLGLLLAWPALAVEDPQGLGFRLRLVAFVPMAAAAAVLVGQGAALGLALGDRWAAFASQAAARAGQAAARAVLLVRLLRLLLLVLLVLGLGLWVARAPARLTRGVVYAHPAMIAAVRGLASAVPRGELVLVSERHLAFMVTWYARVDTAVHPARPPRHRWRLMPLAFIGERTPMARALAAARREPELLPPRGFHAMHRDGLVLVSEDTWPWILEQLPPAARRYYEEWRSL